MAELFIGVFVWLTATAAGMRLLRLCRLPLSPAERWVFGSALGLGVFAYLVFVLGSLGFLSRVFWVALTGGVFAVCSSDLVSAWNAAKRPGEKFPWLFRLAAAGAATAMTGALFGALAPATGQDELCYHLSQPANYLREGRVYAVPFSANSLWPYLMEMLFTLGLVLRNESVAKFFHWAMTVTAAGSVFCWVRRLGGNRQGAGWAALVYASAPAVFIQASFAYVDSALAAYTLLAVLALVTGLRENSVRWTVLAGIFAGLAASTKLLGLIAGLMGTVAALAAIRTRIGRAAFRHALLFSVCAALAGGAWYVRAWVLRGNPVFPFYPEWFGSGWHDATYVQAHGRPGFFGFLTFPWDLTMIPVWFGGEAPGPLFLMLVPAAFLLAAPPLHARLGALFGLLYAAVWFRIDPNARFFFPALAFFSAPAGHAIVQMAAARGKSALAFKGAVLFVFAAAAALGVYHFHEEAAVFFRGDRDSYLRRNERSWGAAQAVNAQLRKGDRILSVGDVRGYAFNLRHPFVLEGDFENMERVTERMLDPSAAVDFWREKGFTHVLSSDLDAAVELPRAAAIVADPALRARFFEEALVVRSGGVRYTLYKILKETR